MFYLVGVGESMVSGSVEDLSVVQMSVVGGWWVGGGPVGGSVVGCWWSVGRLKTCRWVGGSVENLSAGRWLVHC